MDPLNSKSGLDIKTDDATNSSREYEKVYHSHNEVYWGETECAPKKIPKWLETTENRDCLQGFYGR